MTKKIGILGGTFDPIHNGHLEMALGSIAEFGLEIVLLIPSFRPPHKKEIQVTEYSHRYNMCKIACKQFDKIEVSDIEKRLEGISYTYLTLEKLNSEYNE
ncbi:MAG TPA: adenylyltransferase/cytidyltransferase family protein, partial [Clostridia bacterium]|nr:adenylyltransferase/cytidyltransferase family protein [Clostridia bacterium]